MDGRKNHNDCEEPMEEEGAKRGFLRVLFGVQPWLPQKPVEFSVDKCMLVASDPGKKAAER